MTKQLALTDRQLQIVQLGAGSLPVNWRSRFLAAVADQLLALETVSDCAVEAAVKQTIANLHCVTDRICDVGVCE